MPDVLSHITLQFIPYPFRDLLLIFAGIIGLAIGLRFLAIKLVSPFRTNDLGQSLMDTLYQHQRTRRGPRIVIMGGGIVMNDLVGVIKNVTDSLTVVFDVPDTATDEIYLSIYNRATHTLLALSKAETHMSELFNTPLMESLESEQQMGNVLLDTMTRISGNLEDGLQATSNILSVEGRVFPVFSPDAPRGISVPEEVERYTFSEVIRALLDADMIIMIRGAEDDILNHMLAIYPIERTIQLSSAIKIIVDTLNDNRGLEDILDLIDYVIVNESEYGISHPPKIGRRNPQHLSIAWDETYMFELVLIIMRIYEPWARLGARFRTDN